MTTATRRPTAADRRHRASRRTSLSQIEGLEGRQLMTVAPAIPQFATVDLSGRNSQSTQIPVASTSAMEDTAVNGIMPATSGYGDTMKVYLAKGQIDDISLDVATTYRVTSPFLGSLSKVVAGRASSLSVTDATGKVVASASASADSDVVFQAASNGWYNVAVRSAAPANASIQVFGLPITVTAAAGSNSYTAQVRPIGLDSETDTQLNPNNNAADAAKLSFTGGALDAILNGRTATGANGALSTTGTSVSFVGPTGRGFKIDGTWTEARNAATGVVTYSGTNLTLEAANPANPSQPLLISLPNIGPLGLLVTMAADSPSDIQGLYGAVQSTQIGFKGMPLGGSSSTSLISSIGNQLGVSTDLSKYGVNFSGPGITWGIGLGAQASAATNNAPTNPAVPYLYFNMQAGPQVGMSFGKVALSVGQGIGISAVVDPADPSFYLDVTGVPVVNDVAIGASVNELIPYVPSATGFHGDALYGDLFLRGSLALGQITDSVIPADLAGDITLALDPNHLGLANIAKSLIPDVKSAVAAKNTVSNVKLILADLNNISVGVNGTLSLDVGAGPVGLTMPLGTASVEWNGIHQNLAFAGSTVDPFQGTPLASLTASTGASIAGTVDVASGAFDIKAQGSFGYPGVVLTGATLEVSQPGSHQPVDVHFHASTSLGGTYGAAGYSATAALSGTVDMDWNSVGIFVLAENSSINVSASGFGQTDTLVNLSSNYFLVQNTAVSLDGLVASLVSQNKAAISQAIQAVEATAAQAAANAAAAAKAAANAAAAALAKATADAAAAAQSAWDTIKGWF